MTQEPGDAVVVEQPGDAFFRRLCVDASVGIIATDRELRVRFANAAAGRMLGRPVATMIGQPATALVPADHQAAAQRLIERALLQGEAGDLEFLYPGAGGPSSRAVVQPAGASDPMMHLAMLISPVADDEGERVGIALHMRNVTRRMQAAQERADAAKMSALGTLAGAVAHYFSNLLGGLVPRVDFALTQDNPEALRRALRSIATTLTQTGKLTQGLRAFAEGIHAVEQDESLVTVVERFVEGARPRLAKCGIVLETDVQPVAKRLPPRPVMTVLENLTANACEAMPEGGRLCLELFPSPDDQSVFLRISDTGPGIAEQDLPHVFEPFYTVQTGSVQAGGEHLGLGLPVVHGIVRCLGGTVTLCSGCRDGTICSIQFPCDAQAEREGSS